MAKRKYISDIDYSRHTHLIGIASNEPVWKICWELNRLLDIEMKRVILPRHDQIKDVQEDIFKEIDFEPAEDQEVVYYNDLDSQNDQDFFLFRGEFDWKDSSMKAFRHIFGIVEENKISKVDINELIEVLKQSELIILAIDISHIQDINQLLP